MALVMCPERPPSPVSDLSIPTSAWQRLASPGKGSLIIPGTSNVVNMITRLTHALRHYLIGTFPTVNVFPNYGDPMLAHVTQRRSISTVVRHCEGATHCRTPLESPHDTRPKNHEAHQEP